MTQTDQAFIDAFGRASAQPTARRSSTSAERRTTLHGPHVHGSAAKTPLTEAIAERMRQAAGSRVSLGPEAATIVRSFTWSKVVEDLVDRHGDDYLSLAPQATTDGLVLGFAGVHRGSGSTTTVLAMARKLAAEHGPVALVDADPAGPDLAKALGVLRTPTLSATIRSKSATDNAVVHAADDRVSLMVAGEDNAALNPESVASTADWLRRRHPITLIDLGAAIDELNQWGIGHAASTVLTSLHPTGVVLVRCPSDLSGGISAARAALEATCVPVLGMIENSSTKPVQ